MITSTRTPEGYPSRCPICGAETNLEYADPAGDAPCPNCGHLLWLSAKLQGHVADVLGVDSGQITLNTSFAELGADSLDTVELVMALEEEFDLSIPDDAAERIQTFADLLRFLKERGSVGPLSG